MKIARSVNDHDHNSISDSEHSIDTPLDSNCNSIQSISEFDSNPARVNCNSEQSKQFISNSDSNSNSKSNHKGIRLRSNRNINLRTNSNSGRHKEKDFIIQAEFVEDDYESKLNSTKQINPSIHNHSNYIDINTIGDNNLRKPDHFESSEEDGTFSSEMKNKKRSRKRISLNSPKDDVNIKNNTRRNRKTTPKKDIRRKDNAKNIQVREVKRVTKNENVTIGNSTQIAIEDRRSYELENMEDVEDAYSPNTQKILNIAVPQAEIEPQNLSSGAQLKNLNEDDMDFRVDSKSTRHIRLNRRVNRLHSDNNVRLQEAAKASFTLNDNDEIESSLTLESKLINEQRNSKDPNIKSEIDGQSKIVIIPSFRIIPEDELESVHLGSSVASEKNIIDNCVDHPGGIPLSWRVRFENQERYSHDIDRGSKSKRSTRLTYLDAPCYDDSSSNYSLENLTHHIQSDVRGNYNIQKEKVESFQEYGRYEFCICHHDYENLPMIECDNCENWFHMSCINFDDGADGANTDIFYCPNCMEYDSDLEIVMKDGYVPRRLPYIRKPRSGNSRGKKFYHTTTIDAYETPRKNGKRKRKENVTPNKARKRKTSFPPNHETLWDPEATRIDDDFANDHFECDNYGNQCKKAYKKYKDAMLECNICHCTAHVFCPEHPLTHLREEHRKIWCCDACKSCWICQRGDKSEQGLLCDCCDRMYHMECLHPPLSKKPRKNEMWYCPECISRGLEKLVDGQNCTSDDYYHMEPFEAKNIEQLSQCLVCNRSFSTTYSYARHLTTTLHKVRQKRWNILHSKEFSRRKSNANSRRRHSQYSSLENFDSDSGNDDPEVVAPKRKYTRRK